MVMLVVDDFGFNTFEVPAINSRPDEEWKRSWTCHGPHGVVELYGYGDMNHRIGAWFGLTFHSRSPVPRKHVHRARWCHVLDGNCYWSQSRVLDGRDWDAVLTDMLMATQLDEAHLLHAWLVQRYREYWEQLTL